MLAFVRTLLSAVVMVGAASTAYADDCLALGGNPAFLPGECRIDSAKAASDAAHGGPFTISEPLRSPGRGAFSCRAAPGGNALGREREEGRSTGKTCCATGGTGRTTNRAKRNRQYARRRRAPGSGPDPQRKGQRDRDQLERQLKVQTEQQTNSKTREGAPHPERDAKKRHIAAQIRQNQAAGQTKISVDTKKKEKNGDNKKDGRVCRPRFRRASW